jgi:hypothetical protein
MLRVRRLIVTPACRRYVSIRIKDFMLSERELATKYGVPWYPAWVAWGAAAVGVFLGLCAGHSFARTA